MAGRKLLKASLNAEDLNLLLESIENAGTPTQPRFIRVSQTNVHPPPPPPHISITSSSSSVPAMTSSSSSVVAMDTEFVTANANYTAMKVENMLPVPGDGMAALSKLEQEYEVIASSLENPHFFSSQFEAPAPLFTTRSGDAIPVAQPQEHAPATFPGAPELSFAHKAGCTMMDVSAAAPANAPDLMMSVSSQWNLTARGKEYLAQKQSVMGMGGMGMGMGMQMGMPMGMPMGMGGMGMGPGSNSFLLPSASDLHTTSCKLYSDQGVQVKMVSSPTSGPRKHGQIKTYKCTFPDCGKTFITRKEQQNHIARHSSEPKYFCEYPGCTCKYTTKSSLDLHVVRIHGEKKYKCDLCDERYSVRGDLNQHMKRKHNKIRKL